MNTIRFLLIISVILVLSSCGKKGPVRPLEARLPDAVTNVELRQKGQGLLLGWQLPTRNQDNTPLESAPVVDIYRMLFDPENDCPECTDRSSLLYSIDPALPQPALLNGNRYLLQDGNIVANQGYHYRLVPRNMNGQDGRPTIMRIIVSEPPVAPSDLVVKSHDRSASLSWQPLEPIEGQTLIGYRIYRQQDGDQKPPVLLNQRPLTALHYEDFNLENDKRYSYQVRALVKRGEQELESLPSAPVEIIPQAGL